MANSSLAIIWINGGLVYWSISRTQWVQPRQILLMKSNFIDIANILDSVKFICWRRRKINMILTVKTGRFSLPFSQLFVSHRHHVCPLTCQKKHQYDIRADSSFVPSQWEKALLCNGVSHWLGVNLESALWHGSKLTLQNNDASHIFCNWCIE